MDAQTLSAARGLVENQISFGVFGRLPAQVEKMQTVLVSYLLFEPEVLKEITAGAATSAQTPPDGGNRQRMDPK